MLWDKQFVANAILYKYAVIVDFQQFCLDCLAVHENYSKVCAACFNELISKEPLGLGLLSSPALAYWNETRSDETGKDIYMQGIGPDGTLGRPCPVCAPVGGEAYLVNKVDLVMPLIAMGIAVATIAMLVIKQTQTVS